MSIFSTAGGVAPSASFFLPWALVEDVDEANKADKYPTWEIAASERCVLWPGLFALKVIEVVEKLVVVRVGSGMKDLQSSVLSEA